MMRIGFPSPRYSAYTLLELLVALALTSVVVVTLGTWMRVLGRASAQTSLSHRIHRELSAAVRLLRADLSGALDGGWQIAADGSSLRMTSLCALPEQVSAVRSVSWSFSDGFLVRTSLASDESESRKRFSCDDRAFAFESSDRQTLWLCLRSSATTLRRYELLSVDWLR